MRWLIGAMLFLFASAASARVDYAIDLRAPEHHTGLVTIAFPETAGPFLDVKMAAWRTGRYNILNLANGVRRFAATDSAGRPLRWQKIDKSTWRIQLPQRSAVWVSYELYGNELTLRSRHIDDSHAYLNASAVFMYADRYRSDDVTVGLAVPAGWKSFSGMDSPAAHRFVAPNWDILVDSPIETGINQHRRFSEGGRDYDVVIWGQGAFKPDSIAADLKAMVAKAGTIWSSYPFRRYVFMIHALGTPGGGATEHLNSTIIQGPRSAFDKRETYLGFLGTSSHEFVHTWNVKAYRPAGLVPYDYQVENYTDLLWIAEGSTSYFESHLLLRAGLMRPQEYFDALAGVIERNRDTPGTAVQSVAEASFDEWIAPSGDRARNASVNIYAEGELVSWILDLALLQQTGGRVSYRDVHEALYRRFDADERGYSAADVRAILAELTGRSWDAWWARHVDSPIGAVDFASLLNPVGLRAVAKPASAPARAGWSPTAAGDAVRLASVERGSPAWNAGFTVDDVLVAIDGQPVTAKSVETLFASRKPGETVTVTYKRRGDEARKQLTLGNARPEMSVVPLANPTAAQKALFQRWLLIPYPAQ